MIFEKLKTLRIFPPIWSSEEANPPTLPPPPSQMEKKIFEFLDISDHFEVKKKKKKS